LVTNPFARKPKSPVDQVLEVVDYVRADAAETAGAIRDAAARAADALGEATPEHGRSRRLPALGVLAAAGLGVALAIRARAASRAEPAATESKPAAEAEPERPREPKADTEESDAASK